MDNHPKHIIYYIGSPQVGDTVCFQSLVRALTTGLNSAYMDEQIVPVLAVLVTLAASPSESDLLLRGGFQLINKGAGFS